MLFLLSPAKTMDETTPSPIKSDAIPHFIDQSQLLIDEIQSYSSDDLQTLMKISKNLGDLNYERFQNFTTPFTPENAKSAIYLFKGDVYAGLEAYQRDNDAIDYLNEHLVILSGLYGALRPLDLIQPYRLEMGTRFNNQRGDNLYQFWGERITHYLNERIKAESISTIVNLASNEYFSVIDPQSLDAPLITPVFKDLNKKGEYRVISFYAKKARGMMVRYASDHHLTTADQLKQFNLDGYRFEASDNEGELLFLRDHRD